MIALKPDLGHLKAAAAATTKCTERDVVNSPRPVRQAYPGNVHMCFIPCIALKSGPYTFRLGSATYLCSTKIYIMEHEFYAGLSIAIMGVYAVKKLGSGTAKFLDAEVAKSDAEMNAGRDMAIVEAKAKIVAGKIEQDRSLAMKMLFDAAKRENVVLQLEVCLQRSARQSFF